MIATLPANRNVHSFAQSSLQAATMDITWQDCRSKMFALISLEHLRTVYEPFFAELGEFKLHRNPLARNGREHHPLVFGADQLIFTEVSKRIKQTGQVSVLELGCGGSHDLLAYAHGGISEEHQPAILSRSLKALYGSKIDLTVSDRTDFSRYFYVNEQQQLDHSVRFERGRHTIQRPYLDPKLEALFHLRTLPSYAANYQSYFQSEQKFDLIFARNQEPATPELYARTLIQYLVPYLKDNGIILFAFDTGEGDSYSSREHNHTLVLHKTGAALQADIKIYDQNRKLIERITPETFEESEKRRPKTIFHL